MFILGRQPEIGLAELSAVFGNAELVLSNVALVETEVEPNIDRLGSVRKVGRVIHNTTDNPEKFLIEKFATLPPAKITLGISHYGPRASAKEAQKTGVFLKKNLQRSVRVLPNSEPEISDAATLGNRLGTSPNKIELLIAHIGQRLVVAELVGVQDLNAYTLRDRGRPKRDARVGMLPPKLAQTIINLARGEAENGVLLDPFCGTGVVLQEAALMDLKVYGTDLEPRMIDYSRTNLDWLAAKYRRDIPAKLDIGDATDFTWEQPIDFVATETYLGRPYSSTPTDDNLKENIRNCDLILTKFLQNLHGQIADQTGLCIAVPCWFVGNRIFHLPLTKKLAELGYEQTFFIRNNQPLIYHRENQIVGRELLVLRKKS